jgi:hypothetical protein
LEADSNVTDVSERQSEKHLEQSTLTDAGMTIALKPLHINAPSSIRDNLEADSNVTDVSELQ